MERIYIITIPFPPEISGGAKSFFKLIYPLNQDPEFNLQITSIDPNMLTQKDYSLDKYVSEFKINRVKWSGQRYFKKLSRYFNWYTDPYALFAKKCKGLLQKQNSADIYLLRGQFFSTFLLAPFIRHRLGKPVVLFYSDPWLHNPYRNWTPKLRKRTARFESLALESACGVIFTNEETQEITLANYPNLKLKSIVIPHTYLRDLYKRSEKLKREDKIVITYAGYFYGIRQPDALFKAISDLKREKHPVLKTLILQFIGQNESLYHDKIQSLKIEQNVHFMRKMDYLKTLTYLQRSDVLLNLDAPCERSLFLPSKLIDYLGCKLPIWSISPPGPAASLVTEYGGLVSRPDNVEAIKKDLLICIERTRNQNWHLNFNLAEEFDTYKSYPKLKFFLKSVLDDWYYNNQHESNGARVLIERYESSSR